MAAVQSVWVKLYIGQDDQNPRVLEIYEELIRNIHHLKEKIKEKEQLACPASHLDVYPQGTDVSNLEETETLDPGSTVSVGTTSRTPLIVVAPRIPDRDGAYTLGQQQQQPRQLGVDLAAEMQAMRLEIHGVRETLPSVLVGHVITPSRASRVPQVVSSIFDSLGLSLAPISTGELYELPTSCGNKWTFSWKWPNATNVDDRVLERTSYKPVGDYLRGIDLFCVDVSDGRNCVEKLLFNSDVYTKRTQNPLQVRGQEVYLRHRVQGRSDLAILRADNEDGDILRHQVKFVVEIKTVQGYRHSQTGCMREAQLQLIGLNAFNTNNSPPVVLSNLAKTHKVLYLDKDEDWNYSIRVMPCSTFAAAIHFANTLSERACISHHFSRPSTPDPAY